MLRCPCCNNELKNLRDVINVGDNKEVVRCPVCQTDLIIDLTSFTASDLYASIEKEKKKLEEHASEEDMMQSIMLTALIKKIKESVNRELENSEEDEECDEDCHVCECDICGECLCECACDECEECFEVSKAESDIAQEIISSKFLITFIKKGEYHDQIAFFNGKMEIQDFLARYSDKIILTSIKELKDVDYKMNYTID